MRIRFNWRLALACIVMVSQSVSAGAQIISDPAGDAQLRRTDDGADGPFDSAAHVIPDLLEIVMESFAPAMPHVDPFTGLCDDNGLFVRIDFVFAGLVNPPGPIGYDDDWPTYAPDLYGPNPVLGYIEFDIDGNEDTGGEDYYPEIRYLANVGRFGGLPSDARFMNRAVVDGSSFDGSVTTAPFYESNGEEFHFVMLGEEVEDIDVIVESSMGDPQAFEPGEIWWIAGDFFHKAHAYDDFAVLCGSGGGDYEPEVLIQFAHDVSLDRTIVSLVFPKTNEGAARLISPSANPQNRDGCDDNQFSIDDMLLDLYFGAAFADSETRNLPEFKFIADWENQSVFEPYFDPSGWRAQGLIGTAYMPNPVDGDEIIWTDVFPNPIPGDVNGDGFNDALDVELIQDYIADHDGQSMYDIDGDAANDSIQIYDWGPRFCVYDVNYDGFVDALDMSSDVLVGDMNLDGLVDGRDVGPFMLALTDRVAYDAQYPSANADTRGDVNDDGAFNSADVEAMAALLVGPATTPLMGDMNSDSQLTVEDAYAFCLSLTDPGVYEDTFGVNPVERGDMNGDGLLDSGDIAQFIKSLIES